MSDKRWALQGSLCAQSPLPRLGQMNMDGDGTMLAWRALVSYDQCSVTHANLRYTQQLCKSHND